MPESRALTIPTYSQVLGIMKDIPDNIAIAAASLVRNQEHLDVSGALQQVEKVFQSHTVANELKDKKYDRLISRFEHLLALNVIIIHKVKMLKEEEEAIHG